MSRCCLDKPPRVDGRTLSPQCCCNCVFLVTVNAHCCRTPKPKADGCCCNVQRTYRGKPNFACAGFAHSEKGERGRVHDHWPEHSYGCEMYQPRDVAKHAKAVAEQRLNPSWGVVEP